MIDSLKQACIDARLNNSLQTKARQRLQQRLATENLTPTQVEVFTTILDMSEAGIIYAVRYNAEANDYVWQLMENGAQAFEAAYGRPPIRP
jgi:hypothetical protein